MHVDFDDSIITGKFQEKKQDLAEVGATMSVAEFRQHWYSESEEEAREQAAEVIATGCTGDSEMSMTRA